MVFWHNYSFELLFKYHVYYLSFFIFVTAQVDNSIMNVKIVFDFFIFCFCWFNAYDITHTRQMAN